MHSTTTAGEMSPSELAKCRENLKRQWENRQVDEELLQRAWQAAHRVATVLYQDYGASKVAVFGSLAEREWFTENSDIDMVVSGLSHNRYLDALWEVDNLSRKFKIELIDFNLTKGLFRERIQEQSIYIKREETDIHKMVCEAYITTLPEKGKVYVIHKNKLLQRITDELHAIQQIVERITKALGDIKKIPFDCKQYIEKSITIDLINVYRGIEKIFLRIAREVDMSQPPGSEYPKDPAPLGAEWTYELISQMVKKRPERPAVVSMQTSQRLKRFLEFCDYANDAYQHELDYEKVEKHAKRVGKLFDNVTEELDAFTAFLSET